MYGRPTTPPVPSSPQPVVSGVLTEISASPNRTNECFSGWPATRSRSSTVVARSAWSRWVTLSSGVVPRSMPRRFRSLLGLLGQPVADAGLQDEPDLGERDGRERGANRQHHIGRLDEVCASSAYGVLIWSASARSSSSRRGTPLMCCSRRISVYLAALATACVSTVDVGRPGRLAGDELGGAEVDRVETGQLGDRTAQYFVLGQQLVDAACGAAREASGVAPRAPCARPGWTAGTSARARPAVRPNGAAAERSHRPSSPRRHPRSAPPYGAGGSAVRSAGCAAAAGP